jgi:mono/diheme cytochrome c family protein
VLRKFANAIEGIVGVALLVTIVLLFTNAPTKPVEAPPALVEAAGGLDGAALYGGNCAGCHGGDGSGGIGPRLAGGRVVQRFPKPEDQIAVVTNGRGGMPAFVQRLTAEEIRAIVEYTRTVLAGG